MKQGRVNKIKSITPDAIHKSVVTMRGGKVVTDHFDEKGNPVEVAEVAEEKEDESKV